MLKAQSTKIYLNIQIKYYFCCIYKIYEIYQINATKMRTKIIVTQSLLLEKQQKLIFFY